MQLILKKLVKKIRIKNHRKEKTSFCIIDSQSVKNTDTTENKGYDAGKKISGIKRHIAVDTQGLPHAIYITTAEKTDRNSAIIMIKSEKENLSTVQKIIVDAGYTGEKFASAIKTIINANVEVVKRNELHSFVVLPKRWVVERSFAWLEKCRRLWKNCERKLNTSLQMVVLSFISILLKDSKQVLTIIEDQKISKLREEIFNFTKQLEDVKRTNDDLNKKLTIIRENLFELEIIQLKPLLDDLKRKERKMEINKTKNLFRIFLIKLK
ncbi:hypothetical protein SHM_08950 [Spiroplasma ixodetis]|uniref:Transposase IS4-like domain-containing protein n=1 Tax=Spiroplasma ixodetis TaxID=2141 RepID=A0ABN6T1M0_9MOLU|nr:hypothetical protein SHM_08950 [Spiroplasma ixodetis]